MNDETSSVVLTACATTIFWVLFMVIFFNVRGDWVEGYKLGNSDCVAIFTNRPDLIKP